MKRPRSGLAFLGNLGDAGNIADVDVEDCVVVVACRRPMAAQNGDQDLEGLRMT